MGRVVSNVKITNNTDYDNAAAGLIPATAVRIVEVEAMVDTGATWLALPEDVVARIGVPVAGRRRARDALGRPVDVPWVAGLRIEIFGRVMSCDAVVLPAGATPLLGQIVLEGLHLVVDPSSGEVAVNPDSPDDPIYDLMSLVA